MKANQNLTLANVLASLKRNPCLSDWHKSHCMYEIIKKNTAVVRISKDNAIFWAKK